MNLKYFIHDTRSLRKQTYKLINKIDDLERGRKIRNFRIYSKKIESSGELYIQKCLIHLKSLILATTNNLTEPTALIKKEKFVRKIDFVVDEITKASLKSTNKSLNKGTIAPLLSMHVELFSYLVEEKIKLKIANPEMDWHDAILTAIAIWGDNIAKKNSSVSSKQATSKTTN